MTVEEFIEEGSPITKNAENVRSTNQAAFLAGAAGYYTAGLNARLLAADMHDANLGFFDRFKNFLVFGEVKQLLDEFANKNSLVENVLRLKIFQTPDGPMQFFNNLLSDTRKQKASTKKAYDVAVAEVKSLFPDITELITIQVRQEAALNVDNASSISLSKDDREKVEDSLELNALAQELAISAVTGIHTQGMQEEVISNRKIKLIEEIQNDFNAKKPNLVSSEYIKNIANSNFTLSDGYAFYVDKNAKTFNIIDGSGKIITEFTSDVVRVKNDGDRAFNSYDEFAQFSNGLVGQSPETQFNKYAKQLTATKQENVKDAKKSVSNNAENRNTLLNEIAKRNFNLPAGFSIEIGNELTQDGKPFNIDEAKVIFELSESEQLAALDKLNLQLEERLVVRNKDGEELNIADINLKDKGDKIFENFKSFEKFYINGSKTSLKNIITTYTETAQKADAKAESYKTGVPAKKAFIKELFNRNFTLEEGELVIDDNLNLTLNGVANVNQNGDRFLQSFEEFNKFVKQQVDKNASIHKFSFSYIDEFSKKFYNELENAEINYDIKKTHEKNHEKKLDEIEDLSDSIAKGTYPPLKYEKVYFNIVEGLGSFLENMKTQQIANAEKEVANLSKRLNELERQTKEKSLVAGTKEFNEYDDELELNKLAIDSFKYSLYNEIKENYEAVIDDPSMYGLIEKLNERENEDNKERKNAIRRKRKEAYFGDPTIILDKAEKSYALINEKTKELEEKVEKLVSKNTDYLLYSTTCSAPVPQPDGSYQVYRGGGLNSDKMPNFRTMTFEEAKKWYAYSPTREDVFGSDIYIAMSEENRKQANKIVEGMSKEDFDKAIFANELVHVSLPDAYKNYNNFVSQVSQIEKFKENIDNNLEKEIANDINSGKIIFIDGIYKRKDEKGNIVPIFNENESIVVSTFSEEEQQNILFAKFIPEKREALSNIKFNSKGEMLVLVDGKYKQCFEGLADKADIKKRSAELSDKIENEFHENYLDEVIKQHELLAEEAAKLAREEENKKQREQEEAFDPQMSNENIVEVMHTFHPSKIIACRGDDIVSFLKNKKNLHYKEIERAAKNFSSYYAKRRARVSVKTEHVAIPRVLPAEHEFEGEAQRESAIAAEPNIEAGAEHMQLERQAEQAEAKVEQPQPEVVVEKKEIKPEPVVVEKKEPIQKTPKVEPRASEQRVEPTPTRQTQTAQTQPITIPSPKLEETIEEPVISVADASHSILKAYFADTAINDIKTFVTDDDLVRENIDPHNYNVGESFEKWFDRTIKTKGENLTEEVKEEIQRLINEQPLAIKRFPKDTFSTLITGVGEMTRLNALTPQYSANLINSLEAKFKIAKEKGLLENEQAKNLLLKDFQFTEILPLIDNENFDSSMQDVHLGMRTVHEALMDADNIRKMYLQKKKQLAVDAELNKTLSSDLPKSSTPSSFTMPRTSDDNNNMER